jgi:hypothetical protein
MRLQGACPPPTLRITRPKLRHHESGRTAVSSTRSLGSGLFTCWQCAVVTDTTVAAYAPLWTLPPPRCFMARLSSCGKTIFFPACRVNRRDWHFKVPLHGPPSWKPPVCYLALNHFSEPMQQKGIALRFAPANVKDQPPQKAERGTSGAFCGRLHPHVSAMFSRYTKNLDVSHRVLHATTRNLTLILAAQAWGLLPFRTFSVASGLSRFSALRPLGMLPLGPLSYLRTFSLPRGTAFGMAPFSVLCVALSGFPLQRGIDLGIATIWPLPLLLTLPASAR